MLMLPLKSTVLERDLGRQVAGLFGAGEQGGWYDVSDMSTLFQDAAGTVPVTAVEQPVGLMLDKSKGPAFGPELATSAWLNNFAVAFDTFTSTGGGGFTATVGSAKTPRARVPLSLTANKTYAVTFDMVSTGVSALSVYLDGGSYSGTVAVGITSTSDGVKHATVVVTVPSAGLMILPTFSGAGSITVSNVSVKEQLGNHATQATTTKRPVLSRRVNLLTKTEDFEDAAWVRDAGTVTPNAYTSPTGRVFAKYTPDGTNAVNHRVRQAVTLPAVAHTLSFEVKAAGYTGIKLRATNAWVNIDLTTETVGNSLNVSSSTIAAIGDGVYRVSCTFSVSDVSNAYIYIDPTNTSSPDTTAFAGDGTSGIYISAASVTLAIDAHLPYQRVNTATDYDADPAKFPAYLRFDGVDDALKTGNIDFTSTDKMTVWAGVTKLSAAASQAIAELSDSPSSQAGTFWINANALLTGDIWTALASSVSARAGRSFPAPSPSTGVLSTSYDFAGATREDEIKPRWNGAVPVLTGGLLGNAGSGPFGNYHLYIGSRAGTVNYFNGRLYSLIVRGAQTPLSQIEATELYIKQKMRMP